MDLTIYFEVFVSILILLGDIFRDHVVRHITRTAAEVASRPQVPSPKLLLQMRRHSASKWCAVLLPFNHGISRLIVTCGGSEISRCT